MLSMRERERERESMDGKSLTLVNGADAGEFHDAGDDSPVPNGFPSEKTLTDEEAERSDDDVVDHLREEIRSLKGKLEEATVEMEQSEAEKKAISGHVSHLEAELGRTQRDLIASSLAGEDADAESRCLSLAVRDLEAEKSSLAASISELQPRAKNLEDQIEAYVRMEADLAYEKEAAAAAESKRAAVISALELKAESLEEQLKLARVEKAAAEAEAKRTATRVEDLEQAVKELAEAKFELESKVDELVSKFNGDLEVERIKREVDVYVVKEKSGSSWPLVAAATVAGSTLGVTVALIWIRLSKQR